MEFQDDVSFRNIIVAKFQGPRLRKREITQKYHMIFFIFFKFQDDILMPHTYIHTLRCRFVKV